MKTPALFKLLALAALAPAASPAAEFTILIYEPATELAARTDAARAASYWAKYDAFAAELAGAGVLRGGSALSEATRSTVRGSGSADAAHRGARLGGYVVIDVTDLAAAEAWARRVPEGATGVEVLPHRPNPSMRPPAPRAQ